ncbi:titin-like isoform X27 [Asterias rubens]|nr:titin-like isoform X26 [Asterias rubens]XP_033644204.1 titin-like isoform X27 [Asterias rubens]
MSGEPNLRYYSGSDSLSGRYNTPQGGKYRSAMLSPQGYSTIDSRVSTLSREIPLSEAEESFADNGEVIMRSTEVTVEHAAPLMSSSPAVRNSFVTTPEGKRVSVGDPYMDDDGKLITGMVYGQNGRPISAALSDNAPINSVPIFAGFLISFMVDARGGTMKSCRLPGLRVVIPPKRASGPTRVTCRLIKKSKLTTPPPLLENESLATRVCEIGPSNTQFLGGLGNKLVHCPPLNDGEQLVSGIMEFGPPAEKFIGPVLIEVPHFASLRGKEREIVILRSEKGDTWKEHSLDAKDTEVHKALEGYEGDADDNNLNSDRRLCRIVTNDFPQYFAIISRVRQETNTIGTSGGMLSSTVVPQVQAVFPEGTLTKKIKVGLQAQPVSNEVVKKVLGNRVMVSPIVTIEPRRRKFHKAITVTIPIPNNQGIINGYGGDTPTLRLLCSITGGTSPAQWEDITGTTPLTFVDNCVSFTTTVSARFWLMDCKEIDQAGNFARELYHELKAVPFMAKFAIYAKTHDPIESRIRVFCVTDDRTDKTLEQQEQFKEVARSKDVEALEGKPIFIEMAGNLVPVQKSGDQLHLMFSPFHENRLPFFVRVRDSATEPCGRLSFMQEPKVSRGMPPQKALCNLNVTMPPFVKVKRQSESESESDSSEEEYKMEKGQREQYSQQKEGKTTITQIYSLTRVDEYPKDEAASNLNFASIKLRKRYTFLQDPTMSPRSSHARAEIRLMQVAKEIGTDWRALGRTLGVSESDLQEIENENDEIEEQAFVMLHTWAEKAKEDATTDKLADALNSIGRRDIVEKCLEEYAVMDVSIDHPEEDPSDFLRDMEKAMYKAGQDHDEDRSRPSGITIDITGEDGGAFQELQQELEADKDVDIYSPNRSVVTEVHRTTITTRTETRVPSDIENAVKEQAKDEVAESLIKELKEEAIAAGIPEDAGAAELYEEMKEEILEKHEEERREMQFEPTVDVLEESQEEDRQTPTETKAIPGDTSQTFSTRTVVRTTTQVRTQVVTDTQKDKPLESESESSAETEIFVGTDEAAKTEPATPEKHEFLYTEKHAPVRIEVEEAPDRTSDSDVDEYIVVTSPPIEIISSTKTTEEEGINPHYEAGPESINEDVVTADSRPDEEGINPYYEMQPDSVEEPEISTTFESTVQGINPDLICDPEPLDDSSRICGPDLTDNKYTVNHGAQAFDESPVSPYEREVGITTFSTYHQVTVRTGLESSPETDRSESDFPHGPSSEVTIATTQPGRQATTPLECYSEEIQADLQDDHVEDSQERVVEQVEQKEPQRGGESLQEAPLPEEELPIEHSTSPEPDIYGTSTYHEETVTTTTTKVTRTVQIGEEIFDTSDSSTSTVVTEIRDAPVEFHDIQQERVVVEEVEQEEQPKEEEIPENEPVLEEREKEEEDVKETFEPHEEMAEESPREEPTEQEEEIIEQTEEIEEEIPEEDTALDATGGDMSVQTTVHKTETIVHKEVVTVITTGDQAFEGEALLKEMPEKDVKEEPEVESLSSEEEILVEEEPIPVEEEPLFETEPIPMVEKKVVEEEPIFVEEEPFLEEEPLPVEEEPLVEEGPIPGEEEKVVEEEPLPVKEEPLVEEEPIPVEEEPLVEEEPSPVEEENVEEEPVEDVPQFIPEEEVKQEVHTETHVSIQQTVVQTTIVQEQIRDVSEEVQMQEEIQEEVEENVQIEAEPVQEEEEEPETEVEPEPVEEKREPEEEVAQVEAEPFQEEQEEPEEETAEFECELMQEEEEPGEETAEVEPEPIREEPEHVQEEPVEEPEEVPPEVEDVAQFIPEEEVKQEVHTETHVSIQQTVVQTTIVQEQIRDVSEEVQMQEEIQEEVEENVQIEAEPVQEEEEEPETEVEPEPVEEKQEPEEEVAQVEAEPVLEEQVESEEKSADFECELMQEEEEPGEETAEVQPEPIREEPEHVQEEPQEAEEEPIPMVEETVEKEQEEVLPEVEDVAQFTPEEEVKQEVHTETHVSIQQTVVQTTIVHEQIRDGSDEVQMQEQIPQQLEPEEIEVEVEDEGKPAEEVAQIETEPVQETEEEPEREVAEVEPEPLQEEQEEPEQEVTECEPEPMQEEEEPEEEIAEVEPEPIQEEQVEPEEEVLPEVEDVAQFTPEEEVKQEVHTETHVSIQQTVVQTTIVHEQIRDGSDEVQMQEQIPQQLEPEEIEVEVEDEGKPAEEVAQIETEPVQEDEEEPEREVAEVEPEPLQEEQEEPEQEVTECEPEPMQEDEEPEEEIAEVEPGPIQEEQVEPEEEVLPEVEDVAQFIPEEEEVKQEVHTETHVSIQQTVVQTTIVREQIRDESDEVQMQEQIPQQLEPEEIEVEVEDEGKPAEEVAQIETEPVQEDEEEPEREVAEVKPEPLQEEQEEPEQEVTECEPEPMQEDEEPEEEIAEVEPGPIQEEQVEPEEEVLPEVEDVAQFIPEEEVKQEVHSETHVSIQQTVVQTTIVREQIRDVSDEIQMQEQIPQQLEPQEIQVEVKEEPEEEVAEVEPEPIQEEQEEPEEEVQPEPIREEESPEQLHDIAPEHEEVEVEHKPEHVQEEPEEGEEIADRTTVIHTVVQHTIVQSSVSAQQSMPVVFVAPVKIAEPCEELEDEPVETVEQEEPEEEVAEVEPEPVEEEQEERIVEPEIVQEDEEEPEQELIEIEHEIVETVEQEEPEEEVPNQEEEQPREVVVEVELEPYQEEEEEPVQVKQEEEEEIADTRQIIHTESHTVVQHTIVQSSVSVQHSMPEELEAPELIAEPVEEIEQEQEQITEDLQEELVEEDTEDIEEETEEGRREIVHTETHTVVKQTIIHSVVHQEPPAGFEAAPEDEQNLLEDTEQPEEVIEEPVIEEPDETEAFLEEQVEPVESAETEKEYEQEVPEQEELEKLVEQVEEREPEEDSPEEAEIVEPVVEEVPVSSDQDMEEKVEEAFEIVDIETEEAEVPDRLAEPTVDQSEELTEYKDKMLTESTIQSVTRTIVQQTIIQSTVQRAAELESEQAPESDEALLEEPFEMVDMRDIQEQDGEQEEISQTVEDDLEDAQREDEPVPEMEPIDDQRVEEELTYEDEPKQDIPEDFQEEQVQDQQEYEVTPEDAAEAELGIAREIRVVEESVSIHRKVVTTTSTAVTAQEENQEVDESRPLQEEPHHIEGEPMFRYDVDQAEPREDEEVLEAGEDEEILEDIPRSPFPQLEETEDSVKEEPDLEEEDTLEEIEDDQDEEYSADGATAEDADVEDNVPEDRQEETSKTPEILDITESYSSQSYSHLQIQHTMVVESPSTPEMISRADDSDKEDGRLSPNIETEDRRSSLEVIHIEQKYLVDTSSADLPVEQEIIQETETAEYVAPPEDLELDEDKIEEDDLPKTPEIFAIPDSPIESDEGLTEASGIAEDMTLSAPQDLDLQQHYEYSDTLQTPEIQELPDTPESLPEPLVEPISIPDEENLGEEEEETVTEEQVQPEVEEEEATMVDGPTEQHYYDQNLVAAAVMDQVAEQEDVEDQVDEQEHVEDQVAEEEEIEEVELDSQPKEEAEEELQEEDMAQSAEEPEAELFEPKEDLEPLTPLPTPEDEEKSLAQGTEVLESSEVKARLEEEIRQDNLSESTTTEYSYTQTTVVTQQSTTVVRGEPDDEGADSISHPGQPEPVSGSEVEIQPPEAHQPPPHKLAPPPGEEQGEVADEVDSPTKPIAAGVVGSTVITSTFAMSTIEFSGSDEIRPQEPAEDADIEYDSEPETVEDDEGMYEEEAPRDEERDVAEAEDQEQEDSQKEDEIVEDAASQERSEPEEAVDEGEVEEEGIQEFKEESIQEQEMQNDEFTPLADVQEEDEPLSEEERELAQQEEQYIVEEQEDNVESSFTESSEFTTRTVFAEVHRERVVVSSTAEAVESTPEDLDQSEPQQPTFDQSEPPIDESFESELRPSEPERPRASQEDIDALAAALNDLPALNEEPEDAPMPDEPVNGEQEDELFIQGQSLNLEESAPPTPRQQEDRPKILTPSDEEELQDLWDLSTSIPVGATSSSSDYTPAQSQSVPVVELAPDFNQYDEASLSDRQSESPPSSPEETGPRIPKTPDITDLDESPFFQADLPKIHTLPTVEFPPEGQEPVDENGEPNSTVSKSVSSDPNEDVQEIVEEFEETLPDGTIRKVTKKRIIRRVMQTVEYDPNDPNFVMPQGEPDEDGVHRITVHKKTSRKTTIRDGEEVDVTEDVSTNVEEDGQEIESSELREDLQKMVDQFLTEGGGTTTVEVTEEAEESEI